MKSLFLLLILPMLSLMALSAQRVYTGHVVKIADGDTFTLLVNEHDQIKVRMDGIDAPEKKQPFGNKAKEYLSSMIWGVPVTITVTKNDRYGRSVAKVSTDSIPDVNYEMIKAGYAWHYKEYNKDENYAIAEVLARNNRLGLWRDSVSVRPQDYRKGRKH